jgi:hypothetical protein
MKLVLQRIFEKYSNIKFHENPSSGSRVLPCGPTDRQTDMKLIVAFHSFANAPKNWSSHNLATCFGNMSSQKCTKESKITSNESCLMIAARPKHVA